MLNAVHALHLRKEVVVFDLGGISLSILLFSPLHRIIFLELLDVFRFVENLP